MTTDTTYNELHEDFPNDSDWFALKNYIPEQDREKYMLMGRGLGPQGQVISLYKHIITRDYTNLDSEGNTYAYRYQTNSYEIA